MADEEGLTEADLKEAFDSHHGAGAWDKLQKLQAADTEEVRRLCERIGYGRVLHDTARLWAKKDPVMAHTTGPGICLTVDCGCDTNGCDWCCGTGKLTRRVKKAKDEDAQAAR